MTIDPGTSEIKVKSSNHDNHHHDLRPILEAYHRSQTEGTLLSVDFSTVNDYLWLLRGVSRVMAPLGRRGMFYLAAAVSDFFLPDERTVRPSGLYTRETSGHGADESGIGRTQDSVGSRDSQSRNGSSSKSPQAARTRMDTGRIHCLIQGKSWIPSPFSLLPNPCDLLFSSWFRMANAEPLQLETEQSLLIPKARAALQRYGHQIVIGNDLHRRKYEVVFVEPEDVENRSTTTSDPAVSSDSDGPQTPPLELSEEGKTGPGHGPRFKETWLRLDQVKERSTGAEEIEIESLIVERLVDRHTSWIEAGKKKAVA